MQIYVIHEALFRRLSTPVSKACIDFMMDATGERWLGRPHALTYNEFGDFID